MKKINLLTRSILLSLISFAAISATNPISWTLNRSFESPIITGRADAITYTLTNQLPFQLVKALNITKIASPQSEFSYDDHCSGVRLGSKASCTVTIILSPLLPGAKTFQLVIGGYDNNQVKLPELTTIASGSATPSNVVASATGALPYQMQLGVAADYTFTINNYGNTEATNVQTTVSQSNSGTPNITYNSCTTGTHAHTIPAKGFCTITGSYLPNTSTPSSQSISLSATFDGATGNPASAITYTNINNVVPGDILGTIISPYYLPPVMLANQSYNLEFLFTNLTDHQVNFSGVNVGSVTCVDSHSQNCDNKIINFSSNCNNYLPAPDPTAAACQLNATFTAPAATDPATTYTITASVPYTGTGTPATVQTSGAVVSTLPTTRTVNLVNQCDFPVWFSLNGASVAGEACDAQGAGCPPGTSCNTGTKECYWNNPLPNTGSSYKLNKLADGSNTNSVTIPAYNYGGVQWSGNISASTLCNGSTSCGQADCDNNGGSTSCAPGQGFSQPATQAEVTMNVSSSDSYDVEVINGFHIPITMAPIYYPDVPTPANNYTCGVPGSFTAGNGFGACNWTPAQVPTPTGGTGYSSGYYWVSKTAKTCDITSAADQCGPTQLCGLYQDPTNKAFSQLCGDFLGYWSADEVCSYSGLSSTVDNFFSCSQPLPNVSTSNNPPYFPLNATLYRLMECKVPSKDPNPLYNSCYNSYTSGDVQTCCGCVDWWNPSKTPSATINSNGTTQSCGTQVDPQWTQFIQPKIQWMKQTCPSVYTYPFDDKTSGFTCSNNLPGDSNSVGYTITFCQGANSGSGNTGLPPGSINDGRGVGG